MTKLRKAISSFLYSVLMTLCGMGADHRKTMWYKKENKRIDKEKLLIDELSKTDLDAAILQRKALIASFKPVPKEKPSAFLKALKTAYYYVVVYPHVKMAELETKMANVNLDLQIRTKAVIKTQERNSDTRKMIARFEKEDIQNSFKNPVSHKKIHDFLDRQSQLISEELQEISRLYKERTSLFSWFKRKKTVT